MAQGNAVAVIAQQLSEHGETADFVGWASAWRNHGTKRFPSRNYD